MENTLIERHERRAVDEAVARTVAAGGLAAVGLIHLLQTPDAFEEARYLGAMFIAAALASVLLAAAMTRTGDRRAWMAVGGLPALLLAGYVISRSVGLPGFTSDIGEWSEPPALAALLVESVLIAVSATALGVPARLAGRARGRDRSLVAAA